MQRKTWLIACFFIGDTSPAQQYPFVHYTPKDGLKNSRVRKAYQDSMRQLYFMTYGGLSAYDGARFRNYSEIIPVLIGGMKEQQAVISSLQKQIDELKKMAKPVLQKRPKTIKRYISPF